MIRILIADDQKAIHWLLKNFLSSKQNIDLVGIADNGKTAVELVAKLSPDVVLLDLCMPIMDGLSATKLITQSHQKTKIIIFSSQENEQFVAQTIMAGANGYLLKKSAVDNISAALRTVSEGKYYLDPQLEASNILRRKLPVSPEPKLDNWTYFIAKEVITAWRSHSSDRSFSTAQLIADLGLAIEPTVGTIPPIIFELERSSENISLFKRLSTPLDLLQKGIYTRKNINSGSMLQQLRESEVEIKNWFDRNSSVGEWSSDGFRSHLKIKDVWANIFTKVEAYLTNILHDAGSRITLERLKELDDSLQTIRADYQNQYQNQIQKETSAWSAFSILSNELVTSKKKAGNLSSWSAVWKALLFAYKFKLYALLYSYAIEQLIAELIQRVRANQSTVIQTDKLLLDLQSRFSQNIHTRINLAFFSFEQTSAIDPIQLQKELESCIGCPLNQWGKTDSINSRLLEEWLIARIKPVADQFYIENSRSAIASTDNLPIQDRIR